MHHLTADVGWPFLILSALILVTALPVLVPMLVAWVRDEIRLARRARLYEQRVEAARDVRVRW